MATASRFERLLVSSILVGVLAVAAVGGVLTAQETPLDTLTRLRAEYPTPMAKYETGALLNRVAWIHRDAGWTLLGKAAGNNCPTPSNKLVSCDYLVHAPTQVGYDVLIDEEGAGTPTWGGPHDLSAALADGSRTIVLPVKVGGDELPVTPQPPTPTPPTVCPAVDLSPVMQELAALREEIRQLRDKPTPDPTLPAITFPKYTGNIRLLGTVTLTPVQ